MSVGTATISTDRLITLHSSTGVSTDVSTGVSTDVSRYSNNNISKTKKKANNLQTRELHGKHNT